MKLGFQRVRTKWEWAFIAFWSPRGVRVGACPAAFWGPRGACWSSRGACWARGKFPVRMGIIRDSAKLSQYDSSHLTAVAPAGKLEPELLNFTHKDCSWHVR